MGSRVLQGGSTPHASTLDAQEEYAKIQAEKKVEKVQEKLAEAWTMI
jgi:hypothetical protein